MDDGPLLRAAHDQMAVRETPPGACVIPDRHGLYLRLVLLLTLTFSVLIAWGMNFFNCDLMVGLCAGRDVWNGLVGQPDHWSFTGEGRVWIDQGWLSHFAYYTSYVVLKQWGPVLLKGALLGSCLGILFFRCRRLGASVNVSIFALTCGTLGMSTFLNIRAENFGVLYFVLFSTFLAAPFSWGSIRQIGCLATLLFWSNSHGSFVLGLLLVGARTVFLLVYWAVRRFFPGEEGQGSLSTGKTIVNPLLEAASWAATGALCVILAGLGNPFGAGNLRVPLHQVLYGTKTTLNQDWLPLLHWPSLREIQFFYPTDVTPFLLELAVVLVLLGAIPVLAGGPRCALQLFHDRGHAARGQVGMEVLTSLLTVTIAFSLRRGALFAAPALAPLLAFLLQTALETASGRNSRLSGISQSVPRGASLAVALAGLAFVGWIFFSRTLPPYLPGNPFLPDGPPTTRFLDFDWQFSNMAKFMNNNAITGRVYCSLELEPFLVFHVPGVKVFAGTRAQSFYSPKTIAHYYAIQFTEPGKRESVLRTLTLLDKYEVDVVVLRREHSYLPLELALLNSAEWANIFRDAWASVMVRSSSERFRPLVESGGLDTLEYPDHRTRIVAEAYVGQFTKGSLQDEVVDELKRLVAEMPSSEPYWLIGYRGAGRTGCLRSETRAYLRSEADRLSAMDFMKAQGAVFVLNSLVTLNTLLEMDERFCLGDERPSKFGEARQRLEATRCYLERKYSGRGSERMQ